ncbi:PEP-CTERM protein-sorting domain-containing protein [Nitrosomonas sp. Nm166]|nr:PEP-CTERM protein-sorting domain-containing protein [Nitrosomonas sp. Nm166]
MKNYLQWIMMCVVLWFGFVSISNAKSDTISYQNSGKENVDLYTFTATSSGQIHAYFYGSSASYTNTLSLLVNGVVTPETSAGVLNNHTSSIGDFVNLGFVNAGDVLTFQLNVLTTGNAWYSDKSLNTDGGVNHVYSTSFSGDASNNIPAGTFVGFEDLLRGGDLDYDDEAFVFTNMSVKSTDNPVSPIPEPETYAMLLAGLVLVSFSLRDKKTKTAVS